jgi:nicotinamidase-related amidase
MSTKNYTKTRFSASDAALVLIDQQSGVMQLVDDYSPAELRNNVIGLAKLGRVFKLPTVLTTSADQGPNGPIIPELLMAAIEKTGRRNLIMAGVTIEVCLALAAMQAVEAGYNVYGVVDASGGLEVTIRENAVARMKDHGITPISWTTVAARVAAGMELAYRAGLGAGVPRPLSELRPFDGQFRVQDRKGGAEGVLAAFAHCFR